MSGVEEGSGASWWVSLPNRGHCSGQDHLLASMDTLPEGPWSRGHFHQDRPCVVDPGHLT